MSKLEQQVVQRDKAINAAETKLATAKASPRGRVSIKTRGETNTVFADRIDWNMATDRIEVIRGGGTTPR